MTRDDFIDLVYEELSEDSDNCRANRIIDAADEYAYPKDEGLEPCPFCGSFVKLEAFYKNEPITMFDYGYEIKCVKCGIVFRESTSVLPEIMKNEERQRCKESLLNRWNRVSNNAQTTNEIMSKTPKENK